MSEVIAFNRDMVRKNSKRAQRLALIAQIIEVLDQLGGSAHRDVITDRIARMRRLTCPIQIEALRRQVNEVFRDHSSGAAGPAGGEPLFQQAFGPDSRRWAFTRQARAQLRSGHLELEQLAT